MKKVINSKKAVMILLVLHLGICSCRVACLQRLSYDADKNRRRRSDGYQYGIHLLKSR